MHEVAYVPHIDVVLDTAGPRTMAVAGICAVHGATCRQIELQRHARRRVAYPGEVRQALRATRGSCDVILHPEELGH